MRKNIRPCYYKDYLQLDKLLSSQKPVSPDYGVDAHDEMLFIVVHQAYEIWFKQIIHELRRIMDLFSREPVSENDLATINHGLARIHEIQRILLDQLTVMETMTPLDFLDFRDYLIPASGFQSVQFKEIEIRLGLKSAMRTEFDRQSFLSRLNADDRSYLEKLEAEPSLFDLLQAWLERTPFLSFERFEFWQAYRQSVVELLDRDRGIVQDLPGLSDDERAFQLREVESTRKSFDALFDPDAYERMRAEGEVRLSQKALLAALFIQLYRDEPILHMPFQLLGWLQNIDERFTQWRYQHALMVQRMVGKKIGTGGSSGHEYLKRTTENNRFFKDLFMLSSYLIPRSERPKLPEHVRSAMRFKLQDGT